MAHSFDVFDAASTHACQSCQSNGGLASGNYNKMYYEIDIRATKSCIFFLSLVLMEK